MTAPLLDEKVLALQQALTRAGIEHAFGGALALAYYATPRGTVDIDCNVFVPTEEAGRVFDALAPLGVDVEDALASADLRDRGQIRLYWGHTPIDLFFSYDPLHESCLARRREFPFGDGAVLQVLGAEDLVVFKALFDREKDWRDIRELLFSLAGDFDAEYARRWLARILPEGDERLARLESLLHTPATETQSMT